MKSRVAPGERASSALVQDGGRGECPSGPVKQSPGREEAIAGLVSDTVVG